MRRGWKKLLCLIGLHVLYTEEGRPALRQNTKKLSFLVCEPFSNKQLHKNFSSMAVHELHLPRKAFKGIQGKGLEEAILSRRTACLIGGWQACIKIKHPEV